MNYNMFNFKIEYYILRFCLNIFIFYVYVWVDFVFIVLDNIVLILGMIGFNWLIG